MNGITEQETLTGEGLPKFKENSWLKQWDSDQHTPESIIKKSTELFTIKHKRKADERPTYWVASSGGNDSMVVADILDKMGLLEGIFHIRIYGGVIKTLEFIRETCRDKGWRLEVREPYPRYIHVALILETGFPSFFLHSMYMNELKRKTIERFFAEKEIKKSNPVLVTGVR
ncbi:MAG: hypothetical protein KGI08_11235, partial [Thaumarchaeota archaeon]|nr:hypothetical protein [Nitrososphaerota archaeon]